MRHFWIKLAMFLVLWYEVAAELKLDGDRAFLVTLGIVGAGWFLLRMSGQLIGMLGPTMHKLLIGSVVWLLLFWWFAPAALKAVPVIIVLAAAFGIAVAGARCHHWFALHRDRISRAYHRGRSETVVLGASAGLGILSLVLKSGASLWMLAGCALLPLLPFAFGWQMAGQIAHKRADAKFGDEASFRDAGISEER